MPILDLGAAAGGALPTLSVGPATQSHSEDGGGFAFAVTRTGDPRPAIRANWRVQGAGAVPATADDFAGNGWPSGVVTLAPGETIATITIAVAPDAAIEGDEGFALVLSDAVATIALDQAAAAGTIVNDDAAPPVAMLPNLSVAPLAVWSQTRLVAGYGGPLFRLVRAGDAATLDIAAVADGQRPDLAGIAGWAQGQATFVDTVYDQTGAGRHLTQADPARRPRFLPAAAIRGQQPLTIAPAGIGDTVRWFDVPVAVAGSNRAFTRAAVFAGKCLSSGSLALYGSGFGAEGSLAFDTFSEGQLPGIYGGASGFPGFPGLPYRAQAQVLVDSMGPAAVVRRLDGRSASADPYAAGGFSGGRVGSAANGTAEQDWFAEILYPAAVTGAEAEAIRAALATVFDIPPRFDKQLVLAGNSITRGAFVTGCLNVPRLAEPHFAERIAVVNHGLDAYPAQAVQQSVASFFAGLYRADCTRQIFVAADPSNDIAQVDLAGVSDVAAYAEGLWTQWVAPFCASRAAQGASVRVLVPTVLPRRWGGSAAEAAKRDAIRDAYNNHVAQAVPAAGFALLDYGGVAAMADADDGQLYVDGTHPTTAGAALLAPVLAQAVNALL